MKQPQPDTTLNGAPKSYIALLTQSGTDDPKATELKNTYKQITLTRHALGTYWIISDSEFTANKTIIDGPYSNWAGNGTIATILTSGSAIIGYLLFTYGNATRIEIDVFDPTWSPAEWSTIMDTSSLPIKITTYV